jgi:predicted enzyme related to lactoylglutathione lyase
MGRPVVYFDIGCEDTKKTADFYAKLFDWGTHEASPHSITIDTESDTGINGAITSLGHEPHNYVMIYTEVDDMDAYLEKVEELGGEVLIAATEVPGEGVFAWFADPEGNMMGMWQRGEEGEGEA